MNEQSDPRLRVPLDPSSDAPLYRQLYEHLRRAILKGILPPGMKLPSTRGLADDLAISRNTTVSAYEQLLAEGYLEGRIGSGHYVSLSLPDLTLEPIAIDDPSSPATEGRRLLSQRGAHLADIPVPIAREPEAIYPFRHGVPAVDQFPFDSWSRMHAKLWRTRPTALMNYGGPNGYLPLREAIAAYLSTSRGVLCRAEQVIVVSGSQQAIDLTARLLLDPGDRVWMEDPGYTGVKAAMRAAGATLIPVGVDEEGFDFPSVAHSAKDVRLAYVTPAHQYPLGKTMSMPRRLALLDWARRSNGWILEDDYDSEYRYAGRPLAALHGIDRHERVIYVGTFSKVLYPSIRVGYLVVPIPLIEPFVRARALADVHTSTVTQAVLAEFISTGQFARHIRKMRQVYRHRQDILLRAAKRDWPAQFEIDASDSGMHLIVWLPSGVSDFELAQDAVSRGIAVTPLSWTAIRPLNRQGLILGYTAFPPRELREGVRRLGRVLSEWS